MIDSGILFVFLAANLLIGFFSSRNINNFSEYAVWKRSFGSFAICATLCASFIGGGYIMGNAAKVYYMGMIYAIGLLGFSLKEVLIALFVAPRMKKYNDCHSVGDMVGKHYGNHAKVITGIFSVLICMGILGAQVSAMGALFTVFFHMNELLGILIGFGVIIIYASLGGMRGVVYTDVFQFVVLLIGIPLILIFGIHYIHGWGVLTSKIPSAHINPFLQSGSSWTVVGLMLTFMFGEILIPPYAQRLFMAKSTDQTRKATLAAGIVSVPIFLIAGAIGLVAYTLSDSLNPNLAIPYVIEKTVPVGIKGLVIAGLLAVIMSSAAGFLNAAAIAFANDIMPSFFKGKTLSHRSSLQLVRVASLAVGIGSVVFALSIKNILDILVFSYNLWSPIILVPLLAAIFGLKTKPTFFYLSACFGAVATLIWSFEFQSNSILAASVVGVFASFFSFVFCYLFSARQSSAISEELS